MKDLPKLCKECPWRRDVAPGALGGSPPEVYIGQAHGPFKLPCHKTCDFDDPDWKERSMDEAAQCAGAAMYRQAQGLRDRLPAMLNTLEPDGTAFETPEEFMAHHLQIDIEVARHLLQLTPPDVLTRLELQRVAMMERPIIRRTS